MADASRELVDARAALAVDDRNAALEALCNAWRELPLLRIAELATLVARAANRVAELPTKVSDREHAWQELAAARDPATLDTLLAADWPTFPREAKARLAALLAFPADPRIANTFAELWQARRYASNGGNPFWRKVVKTMVAWRDSRVTEWATAVEGSARWYAIFENAGAPSPTHPTHEQAVVIGEIERLVAALSRSTPPRDRSALLAAIYTDPSNDEARAVYADVLLAAGDPRGEFIQLQLLAKKSARQLSRERALERAHGATWGDGLEGKVLEFRRGFASNILLDRVPEARPPAFRTIEKIRFSSSPTAKSLSAFLAHAHVAHVARLAGVACAAVSQLAGDFEELELLAPLAAWPAGLRTRAIGVDRGPLADAVAWATPICTRLACHGAPLAIADEVSLFASSRLDRLLVGHGAGWDRTYTRDAGGIVLTATWMGRSYGEHDPLALGQELANLVANIRVVVKSAVKLEPALRSSLTRHFEKLPIVTAVFSA
ncbi:MAG TPA: TIGR02996 domain-containing protein [Kofleriaceae bacterium]